MSRIIEEIQKANNNCITVPKEINNRDVIRGVYGIGMRLDYGYNRKCSSVFLESVRLIIQKRYCIIYHWNEIRP